MANPEHVILKKGWFPETAYDMEDEKFAFVYMDADLYQPTFTGMEFFFPRMQQGGIIMLCNYENPSYPGISKAIFDFEEKYTLKTSRIHMPARVDAATELRIQEAAKTIYRALGCSGFARVDLFLTPSGELVFNEVNTIPGLTAHSRFPNMMKGIGLSFPQMIDRLLGLYV